MIPAVDPCSLEPVHTIGHIQPHGLLLACAEPELVVRHASSNAFALLGIEPANVWGHSLGAVLGAGNGDLLAKHLERREIHSRALRMKVGPRATEMNCVAYLQDDILIVELEFVDGAYSLEPFDLCAHIQTPLFRFESASDVLELSTLAAGEIQRLSGFDRVLIYRFDEDWNGEVIVEVSAHAPMSYLGLHFPASDIPPQARRLFLQNPVRAIADVDAPAVPIVAETVPVPAGALDLTSSSLRSAAPIHLDYLRNMNVAASMTVSIIVRGQLWGMIACHHPQPRRLDFSTRAVCATISQVLTSQLALQIDNAVLQSQAASRERLDVYMAGVEACATPSEADAFLTAHILELFDADGLLTCNDGVVSAHGATVDETRLRPVIRKLQELVVRGIASSNMLGAIDPSAESFAHEASGALYIGLTDDGADYLLLSRHEFAQTIQWAGDPNKSVSTDASGRLRPRASFNAWQEIVRGRSRPWTESERINAQLVREQLLRLREAKRLRESEERVRYLAQHDSLTGLINRHSLELRLEQFVAEAQADHSSFAVLFIDLDGFKRFNDTMGHDVGDRILKIVATRMEQRVRSNDVVGRLGGDEFIVVLLGLRKEAELAQAVERLLHAFEEPLEVSPGTSITIKASIGLSRYPVDGTTIDVLLRRSDTAMYRAKRSGGNTVETFREDLPAKPSRVGELHE